MEFNSRNKSDYSLVICLRILTLKKLDDEHSKVVLK